MVVPPLKLAEPFKDVILTETLIAILPSLLTPLTVMSPKEKIALLIVTPLPAVAKFAKFAAEVLTNPVTGVQAGVDAVQPKVLSSST